MQIVSLGDNLHEMSKPIFWIFFLNNINLSSAEIKQRLMKIKMHFTTEKYFHVS